MSRSIFWDEEKIQQLIILCCQYSLEAHKNKDNLFASSILINTGRFIEFTMSYAFIDRANQRISDRWLESKLTSILYAIHNAKYSSESDRIILRDINLVIKFIDLNNLTSSFECVGDELPELILPEPYDSNESFMKTLVIRE